MRQLPRLRRFLPVSTALVSGAATDRVVQEDEFPGTARQFTLYTKSKAEIERRLIVPVDYCARAVVDLLCMKVLAHSRYHVSAGPELITRSPA